MTLAQLQSTMSNDELELWMAEESLRNDECPMCGVNPRDALKEVRYDELTCPNCKAKYGKTRPLD